MDRTSQSLSRDDFEFCRRTLVNIFTKCDESGFLHLASMISCMLHCLRPLHRREIAGIFKLLFYDASSYSEPGIDDLRAESAITRLLDIQQSCHASVVREDSSGYFEFSDPRLAAFLRNVPIKGIDRTIRTIVRACVLQVKLNGAKTSTSRSEWCFGEYTAQMWPIHYRGLTDKDREVCKERELDKDLAELVIATPDDYTELVAAAPHGVDSNASADSEWVIV